MPKRPTKLRKGNQTPTKRIVCKYRKTFGDEAVELYNSTGLVALPWQEKMLKDLLAVNKDGLWVHMKYGYSVPRRNGKSEVTIVRVIFALVKSGEKVLYTAHRTTTVTSVSRRLAHLLGKMGYQEVIRPDTTETYDKSFVYRKQKGLEEIIVLGDDGGQVSFRTRTSSGGLGEGFDLMVIDEAQEYTTDQETALQYTVTSSMNPQTIMLGTPPTTVSAGTVFVDYRKSVLSGNAEASGWTEWGADEMSDVNDRSLWFRYNPSLNYTFAERNVVAENKSDQTDYNIQRLGLWLKYSLKSAISRNEWMELALTQPPEFTGGLFVGIKFNKLDTNVSLSVARKTKQGEIFVQVRDCRPIKDGRSWMVDYITSLPEVNAIVIDGANGQHALFDDLNDAGVKKGKMLLPSVAQVVKAYGAFEDAINDGSIVHMAQPSLVQAVSNCEKRSIGSNGGFGYQSQRPDEIDSSLMDSVIYAYWACKEYKEKKKERFIQT